MAINTNVMNEVLERWMDACLGYLHEQGLPIATLRIHTPGEFRPEWGDMFYHFSLVAKMTDGSLITVPMEAITFHTDIYQVRERLRTALGVAVVEYRKSIRSQEPDPRVRARQSIKAAFFRTTKTQPNKTNKHSCLMRDAFGNLRETSP